MSERAMSERRVLFFGGKGGVGKTTVAAAFALRSADRGDRTLLVSTDPAHSTSDILGTAVGPEPTPVAERLWALEIDPAREVDRYIEGVKRRVAEVAAPRMMREVERQIDAARVSPGAEEAAAFERFTRILDEEGEAWDRIVFDTAPTGHTLRLMALPEQMGTWVDGLIDRRRKLGALKRMWRNVSGGDADDGRGNGGTGADDPALQALERRKGRFERARALLVDTRRAAFVFVLIPERLSIEETRRAVAVLGANDVPVGALIVNRVLPDEADGRFLAKRRAREAEYLDRIERVFAGRGIYHLPLFETDVHGKEMLRRLGRELPP